MNKLLALLLLSLVAGVLCCGPNEQSCGTACYVPGQYTCYSNSLLCPSGWDVCQGQCYNPAVYDCVQTAQYNFTTDQYIYQLCPEGYLNCGEGCYDPSVYTCYEQYEGYMCLVGYNLCGTSCYDPSVYHCVQGNFGNYVCPMGYNLVCNGTCITDDTPCPGNTSPVYCCTDPSGCFGPSYVACPGSLTCCPVFPQWEASAGGTCYDPTESACSSCPVYNPNHPVQTICPIDAPICCEGCVATTEQCCHDYGTYAAWNCPASDTCCGYNNIAEAICCAPGTTCYGDTSTTTP